VIGSSVDSSFVHSGAAIVPKAYYRVRAEFSSYPAREVGRTVYQNNPTKKRAPLTTIPK
jgi:hypothetical protein